MENTMIQIRKETANKLKTLKEYDRETYDEIINKMMQELREYVEEDSLELNEETKKQLELARKTPLSRYIDHESVKKELLK